LDFIKNIYIIGAGISGLSIYEFSNNKDNIFFIEKNKYNGGRIKSIKSGSSIFEIGSQFFCKSDKNIWNIIKKKKLENDILRLDFTNMGFFFENNLMNNINDIGTIIDNIIKNKNKNGKNIYFDEWFLNNFNKEKLYIPKGIIRAITFLDSSRILKEYGVYILETFFDDCFTLRRGLQDIINSISQDIKIKNLKVRELIFKDNKIIKINTNNENINTNNDLVILTAPPGEIEIHNHKKLFKILSEIKYSGCAVIIFKIKKDFEEQPDYIFFPEEKYKISVIEKMKIHDDIFLGCLIPYNYKIDKDEIISYTIDFLGKFLKCKFDDYIIETYYENWDKGIPIVDKNYIESVNKLNVMKFDNLFFAGDYTTLFPSMESSVKSGVETIEKIEKYIS
jgi:protoporphyrinogen oxidase